MDRLLTLNKLIKKGILKEYTYLTAEMETVGFSQRPLLVEREMSFLGIVNDGNDVKFKCKRHENGDVELVEPEEIKYIDGQTPEILADIYDL